MLLKELLLEDQELSLQEAVEWYLANASQWHDVRKPLWRVSRESTGDFRVREAVKRQRKSLAGTGQIQRWMEEDSDAWRSYPHRSASIFTSTSDVNNVSFASIPSEKFAIYPANGTKMGVTPDGWRDFNTSTLESGVFDDMDVQDLIVYIDMLSRTLNMQGEGLQDILDAARTRFVKGGAVDGKAILATPYGVTLHEDDLDVLEELILNFEKRFDPEVLGFEIETTSSIADRFLQPVEVWFSGKYLAVRASEVEDFISAVKDAS